MLQVVGTRQVGELVDDSVDVAGAYHRLLQSSHQFEPTYIPQLNLQCFQRGGAWSDSSATSMPRGLIERGSPWVSLSHWRGEPFVRSVLLLPATGVADSENRPRSSRRRSKVEAQPWGSST